MEDKKVKEILDKIPDADENGDPIYKIADEEKSEIPLFLRDNPNVPQGDAQDITLESAEK